MITLTSQTLRKIDRYPDDDDDGKWMGAALKYLATYDGREYLIKPDVGWPSDSTRERVAAAFYRAIGVRTANVVRAMVDGTPSVAVRIIDGVEPIGDGMYALCKDAALDVVRGVLGAALIGDGDKHAYNFITDGFRAWSIDHGLAFGNDSGKINYTGAEHLTTLTDAGIITWQDVRDVLDSIPANAGALAEIAYRHASAIGYVDVDGWRAQLHERIDRIIDGHTPEDDYDEDECDCEECMPVDAGCETVDHREWSINRGWYTCTTRKQ